MNIDKEKIIYYLKKTELNPNIIEYVNKKFIGIGQIKSIIEKTIKESIGVDKDELDKNIINELMKGNEKFCVTSEGNLWIKKETSQQEAQKQNIRKIAGQTLAIPNFNQDNTIVSTMDYVYIESKNDDIKERRISINNHNKLGNQYYSGKINEIIYNKEIERLFDKSAQWNQKEEATIPNEELITSIKKYSDFIGKSVFDSFNSSKENFYEWNSLLEKPKTFVEKNFQKEIVTETAKRKITIDKVKNFFSRFQNKEHDKDER